MKDQDTTTAARSGEACGAVKCDPDTPAGPPREGGGTTGEGNLSPQQASRTGGATGGVGSDADVPSRAGTLPPDA